MSQPKATKASIKGNEAVTGASAQVHVEVTQKDDGMLSTSKRAQTGFQGRQGCKKIFHRPTMAPKGGKDTCSKPYLAVAPVRNAICMATWRKQPEGRALRKTKPSRHNDAMTLVCFPDTTNFLQGNDMQVHNKIMQDRGGQFKRFPLDIPSTELKQATVPLGKQALSQWQVRGLAPGSQELGPSETTVACSTPMHWQHRSGPAIRS